MIKLAADGLSLAENQYTDVTFIDESSTEDYFLSPWHFKRANMNYLLFSDIETLRIARSTNGIAGPYTLNASILIPKINGTWNPSLVKEDNDTDVLIWGNYFNSEVCLAKIVWQTDNWPKVLHYSATKFGKE